MDVAIIENRIRAYRPANKSEELNALKEISQELTLSALSRAGLFGHASFMGGTCLRILHALPRFSEDLDFSLKLPNHAFSWGPYLEEIRQEFAAYGLHLQVKDRSETKGAVRKAFLKEDSFGQVLQLAYERTRSDTQVIQIKLEIDTNPPAGAEYEPHVLPFPIPYSVTAHKLSSLFAGKLNAILTRSYAKGRDWFDFIWYINQRVDVNLPLLRTSLAQFAYDIPEPKVFSLDFVKEQVSLRIASLDWLLVREDVTALLRERDQATLALWNVDFFQGLVKQWSSK